MISKTLEDKAIDFIREFEALAKDDGYQTAKKEYDAELAKVKTDYEAKVKVAYQEGYNKCKSEIGQGAEPTYHETTPTDEPANYPAHEGYSREKVVSELLAIKGNNQYAFGIVDVLGNVYANGKEWEQDGKPQVLGIGFTDGTHHLCMGTKAVSSCRYGDNGKYDGVFTSTDMWGKVLSDYAGLSNSEGIVKVTKNSIAEKCAEKSGYLPAYAELNAYWKRFEEVDLLLKAIGGDVLRTTTGSQIMWTSTNKNDTTAYGLMYYSASKKSQPVAKTKTTSYPTRVFFNL